MGSKLVQRTEPSVHISEFNLTEIGKEKVKLSDLIKTLKKSTKYHSINKQLKDAASRKKLDVPLSKPQAEKIKRTIAYDKVTDEVSKWDTVVHTNRVAEQIIYPLKQPEFRLEAAEDFVKRFQTRNDLEKQVDKLLNNSDNVLSQERVLTVAEERALKAKSLYEAKLRHAELGKMRALLSYKEAKARRQKRIKSKKYHRILKKEKMRKLLKDFEELQKKDPEAAEEKLKEADKVRILERVTLKHKGTGKWAKHHKLRAKYDPDSRNALKEQKELGRQLTEKVIPTSYEENAKNTNSVVETVTRDEFDDILNMYHSGSNNVQDVDLGKYFDGSTEMLEHSANYVGNSNKKHAIDSKNARSKGNVTWDRNKKEEIDDVDDDETLVYETCERVKTIEDFDTLLEASDDDDEKMVDVAEDDNNEVRKNSKKSRNSRNNYLKKIAAQDKPLDSVVISGIEINDDDEALDDDDVNGGTTMEQAFADEHFVRNFRAEKRAAVEKEGPKGIDLFLPGWGSWGGAGIIESKRKKKRFFVKIPDVPMRKDHTLGSIIMNEQKDEKAAVHQVSNVPFPFKGVDQFESSIRQPIGNTWNPESSFQKLIAPKVVTKMGKIIEPIEADDVDLSKKTTDENVVKRKKLVLNKKHKGGKGNFKRKGK